MVPAGKTIRVFVVRISAPDPVVSKLSDFKPVSKLMHINSIKLLGVTSYSNL